MPIRKYFRRQIAITNEHGSWVFLLSPMLIGIFAGGAISIDSIAFIAAALSVFLLRQPMSIMVKAYSGRRSRSDLPAARFWTVIYGGMGAAMAGFLILNGFGFVLFLAIPGLPIFIWHLYLISKRDERRKIGIEIVGSGVLALSAMGAYWVSVMHPAQTVWWLWGLSWFQSAASIVYAYLRLEQRTWVEVPIMRMRLQAGSRALLYTSFNLLTVLILSAGELLPTYLAVPYGVQWLETVWGTTLRPAIGQKPTRIGLRQLVVSTIFTLLFIITWNL